MTTAIPSGYVCQYKKQSFFSSYELRYISIEDERMKVFKNEKEYVQSKKRKLKPSITVVLRNARLKVTSEARHPYILGIQIRGTHHCLSFDNRDQLKQCQSSMIKVIQSANLIRPAQDAQNKHSNIDENDVNTKYRKILSNLGLPNKKIDELINTQSFVSKMEIVTQNQSIFDDQKQNNNNSNNKSGSNDNDQKNSNIDVSYWIKLLRRPNNIAVSNITDLSINLYENNNVFMINFINEQGLTLLVSLIPSKINNIKFQLELLQCFKVICDKTHDNEKIGLKFIVNDNNAIQGIIDLFDSEDSEVSLLIIKLLSVICWHSPEGFDKVIDALEHYAEESDNLSMWLPIVTNLKPMIAEISNVSNELNKSFLNGGSSFYDDQKMGADASRDQFAFEYVLYAIGLINAILNSFTNLEDRVSYRKDLEQLGFDKIVSYLEDLIVSMEEDLINNSSDDDFIDDPWIDKMEEHLDLYQAVKLKDMRDTSLDGIDVSSPQDLFEFLDDHCVADGFLNEFTHILQCLTTIPRNAPYLWSTIEKIVSYGTAPIRKNQINDILNNSDPNDDNNMDTQQIIQLKNELKLIEQNPETAFPSFEQLKIMLSRYDQDLAFMESENNHYKDQIDLLEQQITNLKYTLKNQQFVHDKITKENLKLKNKHRAKTSGQIIINKDDFKDIIGASKRKGHHKRKSSLLNKIGSMFQSKYINDDHILADDDDTNNNLVSSIIYSSLTQSSTSNTPPPPIKHQKTGSRIVSFRKRELASPTSTASPVSVGGTIGLPPPPPGGDDDDDDDIKNAEPSGSGGLPAPPMSPSLTSGSNGTTNSTANGTMNGTMNGTGTGNGSGNVSGTGNATGNVTENTTGSSVGIVANGVVTAVVISGPPDDLKKYLKMLKMKIPKVAVLNKMRQDGKDPDILEEYLDNGGSIDPQPVNTTNNTTQKPQPQKSNDPPEKLKRYIRMHKMKIPLQAIKNKMKQNSDYTDNFFDEFEEWINGNHDANTNTNTATVADTKPREPPEKLKRWLRMHKMKIPLHVIKNKMKQAGDDPQMLIDWLEGGSTASPSAPKEPPEKLKRWLKMHKMKIPLQVIKNKMKQAGDDPQMLIDWLEGGSTAAPSAPKEPPEKLKRWLKMHKMKIPLQVIKNKMKQAGDDPQMLIDWLDGGSTASVPKEPPEKLKRWLKMHKMKIPLQVIKNKMKQAGDDPQMLVDWLNGGSKGGNNTKSKPKKVKKKKEDPYALPPGMKAKKVIKPANKMRALHWSKVRPKEIKDTIWDGLNEDGIKIDIKHFESMFQTKIVTKKDDKKSPKSKKDDKIKNEEIHLVDGKRSYNVDIGLNRFKLSHHQIKDAILLLDESVLNPDKVSKLINYVPTADEQEVLRGFDGDVSMLAHAEKFFLTLSNIPNLTTRMELWQFKLSFNELIDTQNERVMILKQTHDQIKNSKKFETVLKYILAFGNYMNGGTKKGQAFGFKLSSLRQLQSAKSLNGSTTLLEYLVLQIEKNDTKSLEFVKDFDILKEGSRLDTSQLAAEVSQIGGKLRRISKLLKSNKDASGPKNKKDLFDRVMKKFLDIAQPKYNKLKKLHDDTKQNCVKLAEYFNCKKDIKFEFFKDLYQFSESVKNTRKKINEKRKREAKEAKNREIKAKRRERLQKKRNSASRSSKQSGYHSRTSSGQAQLLYKKNKLAKKRGSIKKGNGNGGMDPQLLKMLTKQQEKSNKTTSSTSYNQRRQLRNSRSGSKIKNQNKNKSPIPTSLTNSNTIITYSTPSEQEPSEQKTTTITASSIGPASPIQPTSPFQAPPFSGLPPPQQSYDDNDDIDMNIHQSMTDNVVNDIKMSAVQDRRRNNQSLSKSRTTSNSKSKNRKNFAPLNKKKKKKKGWFKF